MEGSTDKVTERWGRRVEDSYFQQEAQPYAFEKPTYAWREGYTEGNAPADEQLEYELYGEENRISTGKFFADFSKVSVSRKGGPDSLTPLNSVSFFFHRYWCLPPFALKTLQQTFFFDFFDSSLMQSFTRRSLKTLTRWAMATRHPSRQVCTRLVSFNSPEFDEFVS